MKSLSLILLLSGAATFAMQLDQQALQEFVTNKKLMISVSEGKVDANNPLYKEYVSLSKLDAASAGRVYSLPSIQEEAQSLFDWLSNTCEYRNALAHAQKEKTTEAWEAFRKGNGPLIQRYFDENGIKTITTSVADFFNGNAHLDAEQVEKVVAQSFVIYYIRQMQREQTEVKPSAIQIK